MAKYITECKLNYFNSKKAGKIAIVTMDNGQQYNIPNTWGTEALESLNKVLDTVEKDPDVKGWFMTGKPFIFNVGADIMSANPNVSREEALQIGLVGHKAFKRIMDLKIPTMAAINGATMGGGCEVGLYHNYRTISKSPGGCDHYALPECFLGLVPGWGGTQLVTKLAGPQAAIDLIIMNPLNMNKMINSVKAYEMGLADFLLTPGDFTGASLEIFEKIITGELKVDRKKVDPKMSDDLYNRPSSRSWAASIPAPKPPTWPSTSSRAQQAGPGMRASRKRPRPWLTRSCPTSSSAASTPSTSPSAAPRSSPAVRPER